MRDGEHGKAETRARCLAANMPSHLVLTNVLSQHEAECKNLINCCFYEPRIYIFAQGILSKIADYFFIADKFVHFNSCLRNIKLEIAFCRCVFAILTEKTSETSVTVITEN